jgi:hypothetical protein
MCFGLAPRFVLSDGGTFFSYKVTKQHPSPKGTLALSLQGRGWGRGMVFSSNASSACPESAWKFKAAACRLTANSSLNLTSPRPPIFSRSQILRGAWRLELTWFLAMPETTASTAGSSAPWPERELQELSRGACGLSAVLRGDFDDVAAGELQGLIV